MNIKKQTTNFDQIDYGPLKSLKVHDESVKLSRIGLALSIVVGMVFWLLVLVSLAPAYTRVIVTVYISVIVGAGAILLVKEFIKFVNNDNQRLSALKNFALANNFQWYEEDPLGDRAKGTIFGIGYPLTKARDVLEGTISNYQFSLFTYTYRLNKDTDLDYRTYVMQIELGRRLPHMVIDSRTEGTAERSSVLPGVFDRSQRVTLEGDFSKYFDLYVPDTHAISALSVIAPDVMLILLRHATACDVEIIDNKLNFYWAKKSASKSDYIEFFSTASEVLQKVGKKLTSSNIFTHPIEQSVNMAVTTEAMRLRNRKRFNFRPMYIGVLVYLFLFASIIFDDDQYFSFAIKAAVVVGAGVLVLLIIKQSRRSKLKQQVESNYKSKNW